eukprot:gb/GEZN01005498.1/.p1 GENE.gb/GEZN01005498.1/~~gb/GEZN01005498.1/.p1  ORF type:complete len:490 (-),score=58.60 gb/GEZN01005498.1/:238-1707(-)
MSNPRTRSLPEELQTPPKPSEFSHLGNAAKRQKLIRQHSTSQLSPEEYARFRVRNKEFTQQFANIYFTRLQMLRQVIRESLAQQKHSVEVLEATNKLRKNEEKILIGTLYKEMKLKPCILDEYSKKLEGGGPVGPDFISSDDSLVLEDQFGRVPLLLLPESGTTVSDFTSGLVLGVQGRQRDDGYFEVVKVISPGLPPQPTINPKTEKRGYVAFVSGLDIGSPDYDPLPVQLMCDFLTGLLGATQEQSLASKVVRVILAGNSLYPLMKAGDFTDRTVMDGEGVEQGLKALDTILTQLCATVPVTLMSGERDPVNYALPQSELLLSLFPSARTFNTFGTATNPALMDIEGIKILGSSGQPLTDLMLYSSAPSPLVHLERTLRWRNIAPTAPDTLACYPFQAGEDDPFVINTTPHIYFASNQDRFESKVIQESSTSSSSSSASKAQTKICVLTIPSFSKTQTIVLVNLDTLAAHPVNFSPRVGATSPSNKE